MPFYKDLKASAKNAKTRTEAQRVAGNLLRLRQALDDHYPTPRNLETSLLLGTWNIKEFGGSAYGGRTDEAMRYIAEIVARHDLIAIQEVNKNLKALDTLVNKYLGSYWEYLVSDETMGQKGNDERMAYLYDSRKVRFGGLAGEVVISPIKEQGDDVAPSLQPWRTPFICGFKCGWAKIMLVSVHHVPSGGEKRESLRTKEIEAVAGFMKERAEDNTTWTSNIILLGDFNIQSTRSSSFKMLAEQGFRVPESLVGTPTNTGSSGRPYDQIAFYEQSRSLRQCAGEKSSGVFRFFEHVLREDDHDEYKGFLEKNPGYKNSNKKLEYYRQYWRPCQMSDHYPMWVALEVDYSDKYLEEIQKAGKQPTV